VLAIKLLNFSGVKDNVIYIKNNIGIINIWLFAVFSLSKVGNLYAGIENSFVRSLPQHVQCTALCKFHKQIKYKIPWYCAFKVHFLFIAV